MGNDLYVSSLCFLLRLGDTEYSITVESPGLPKAIGCSSEESWGEPRRPRHGTDRREARQRGLSESWPTASLPSKDAALQFATATSSDGDVPGAESPRGFESRSTSSPDCEGRAAKLILRKTRNSGD